MPALLRHVPQRTLPHGVAMGMATSSALLRVEDRPMSRRYARKRSIKPKGIDESGDAAMRLPDANCVSVPDGSCIGIGCMHDAPAPLCDIATHPCRMCGRPIADRYPQFTECTACAVAVNTEAMIPWRTMQREIALQRIAEMKMRLHENTLEG